MAKAQRKPEQTPEQVPEAKPERQSYSDRVAQTFIDAIQAGTAKWMKPWSPVEGGDLPYNPTTGNRYRGINSLFLDMAGHEDPRWMTYKQASELGAQVKRGAVGVTVEYWQWSKEEKDPQTQEKHEVKLDRPRVFWATVFNAEQIQGLPALVKSEPGWEPNARADDLIQQSGAMIEQRAGNRAFYSPASDKIVVPAMAQFGEMEHWYATVLHELSHWTSAPERCAREIGKASFGSEAYAKEELLAEIASYMVCRELGLARPGLDEQHQAYVGSWLKALQDDPREIFRAAAGAERAMGYLMQFDRGQVHSQAQKEARKLEPIEREPEPEQAQQQRRSRTREPIAAGAAR